MPRAKRQSPENHTAEPDFIKEFDCGCVFRHYQQQRPEWDKSCCAEHSRPGLETTHNRFRLSLQAVSEYRLVSAERQAITFAPNQRPRTFTEMSAAGGFNL